MINDKSVIDGPTAVVVKFESAQSFRDYETASKLINIESVYGKLAKESNISADSIWKQFVEFNFSIGNSSSKFTNSFPFHKYEIVEIEYGNTSTVQFIRRNIGAGIKEIKYTLNLIDNKWVITKIDYTAD